MNRPLYVGSGMARRVSLSPCGYLTSCLIVSSQTGRLRVNSTYILGDSPDHRDNQILQRRSLFIIPATVEPHLLATLSQLQKYR